MLLSLVLIVSFSSLPKLTAEKFFVFPSRIRKLASRNRCVTSQSLPCANARNAAAALAALPPQHKTSNPAGSLGHGLSHGLLIAHRMGNNRTTGFKVAFPLFLPFEQLTCGEYQRLHVFLIKWTFGIPRLQAQKGKPRTAEPVTNTFQHKRLSSAVPFHGNSSTGSHQGFEQEEEEGHAILCMAITMLKRRWKKSH